MVPCTGLIPGIIFSDKQKLDLVTCDEVLNIMDGHFDYAGIICCTCENYAAAAIHTCVIYIKPTVVLGLSMVSDQEGHCVIAGFQYCMLMNNMRHDDCRPYNPPIGGQTEQENGELTEMFPGHELHGNDCSTASPKVQK